MGSCNFEWISGGNILYYVKDGGSDRSMEFLIICYDNIKKMIIWFYRLVDINVTFKVIQYLGTVKYKPKLVNFQKLTTKTKYTNAPENIKKLHTDST